MGNAVISNAQLIGQTTNVVTLGNVTSSTANIVFGVGSYQTATTQGNTQLNLTGWPSAGLYAAVTLQLTTTVANANITLPATVSQGLTGIQGIAGNVITFAQTGTYNFEFTTSNGGTTVTIQDLSRPLSFYTNSVNIGGNLTVGGNILGSYIIGDGSQLTNLPGGVGSSIINGTSNVRVIANSNVTVNIAGTSNVAVFATTGGFINGILSASGTITGGNVATAGTMSASGTIIGGNVATAGTVSATGNIAANYFLGNGSALTGVVPSTRISSGTTEIAIEAPSGNIQASISGTANVVVFTPIGVTITGNLTSSNISTSGRITATGNITAGNILTAGIISSAGNITCGFINATGNVSLTGNVIAGNLTTGAQVVATGNVKGGNILTDGTVVVLSATAIPAGGSIGQGYLFSSTANFGVFFGSGAPTLVAAQGSLYLRSDGSTTNNRMYINTDGSTGWTAVTTAS
jgi:hypothetical protein